MARAADGHGSHFDFFAVVLFFAAVFLVAVFLVAVFLVVVFLPPLAADFFFAGTILPF